MEDGRKLWKIGGDGGFLRNAVECDALLLAPAQRADVILDFTGVTPGTNLILRNLGPDDPYQGVMPSIPPVEGDPVADENSTGQVMRFRVIPTAAPTPPRPPTSWNCRQSHPSARRRRRVRSFSSSSIPRP